MEANEDEAIIKTMFDQIDRDKSESISKFEIESLLQSVSDGLNVNLLADRILLNFDLREKDLSYDEFRTWMTNEINVAKARGFSENFLESLKVPLYEVVLSLDEIKTRLDARDKEKLEWCIVQILRTNSEKYEPEIAPIEFPFLRKETLSNIDEYSNLGSIRLAVSDAERSSKSIDQRLSSQSSFDLDVEIHLPVSFIDVSDFSLDIFSLSEQYGPVTLLNMYAYLSFTHWNLFNSMGFEVQTFLRYVSFIGEGYKKNPYHNVLHAADVLQASHVFLHRSNLVEPSEMGPIHISALLIAAIVHDYKHPGLTNNFLFLTGHKLAIRYNDISILESYHAAKAFEVAQRDTLNIFVGLTKEEFRSIRKLIVKAVLDTDMSKHLNHIGEVQTKLGRKNLGSEQKEFLIGTLLHLSDLSNPCRSQGVSEQWALKVCEEFFLQGDKEKEIGMDVSPLCDRMTLNIAKSQIGFISGVIMPYVIPICKELAGLGFLMKNLTENRDNWAGRIEEFQKKLNP